MQADPVRPGRGAHGLERALHVESVALRENPLCLLDHDPRRQRLLELGVLELEVRDERGQPLRVGYGLLSQLRTSVSA